MAKVSPFKFMQEVRAEGQKVTFDLTKGPKGLQAQNVRPL